MPRKNKANKKIGRFSTESMSEAIKLVQNGVSIREASRIHGLAFQTVQRNVKKYEQDPNIRLCPNYRVRQVFTMKQENILCEYIVSCAKMFYGLSREDTRRIAYETAIQNKIKVPQSWEATKTASLAWLKGFQKRHPNLSLRTPEGCSLSRATGFNKFNVEVFFNKLE